MQIDPQVKRVERPESARSQLQEKRGRRVSENEQKTKNFLENSLEDGVTGRDDVDVGDRTESENGDDRPERTSRFVNVGEDLGSVTSFGEGGEDTGSSVDARETDGEDGNADYDVEERVETGETSEGSHDDERRCSSSISSTEETLLVGGDVETNDEEGREVDNGDTPEGTLDSGGKSLARVGSFSSGDTDELSSGERESGSDEYSADTLESVSERSGISPVSSTNLQRGKL